MWGHISDGYLWMTRSDLQNDIKMSVLHATTDLFKKEHPTLFRALMCTKGEKLKTTTVLSCCSNYRHLKTLGSYNKDTETCVVLYDKHVELLNIVGFSWRSE